MIWQPAALRALRSFLQGCVATLVAFAAWLGAQSALDWGNIKVQGSKIALGLLLAATYALISFIHNFLELNWGGEAVKRFRG